MLANVFLHLGFCDSCLLLRGLNITSNWHLRCCTGGNNNRWIIYTFAKGHSYTHSLFVMHHFCKISREAAGAGNIFFCHRTLSGCSIIIFYSITYSHTNSMNEMLYRLYHFLHIAVVQVLIFTLETLGFAQYCINPVVDAVGHLTWQKHS